MTNEQTLKQALDAINKAKDAVASKRNEEDRKFIIAGIGKDLVALLTPLLHQVAINAAISREEMKSIISQIKVEAPNVNVEPANVTVEAAKVNVPEIEFPKLELIAAVKDAIKGIKFPKTELKVPDFPKEMKVAKIEDLIKEVKKLADAKMTVEFSDKYSRENPLPVILTDEDGIFYKAVSQMISAGGGGGLGGLKLDGSGNLQVNVAAGSAAGTEYTEADVDATITGPAVLFEGPANALTPPLVDANGHVQVDVLSGGGGGTLLSDGDAVNAANTGQMILGTDGANYQVISVTAAGLVNIADGAGSITIDGAVTNTVLSVVGGGAEATAQRVTIANDSTGVLSVDDNGGALTVDGTLTGVTTVGTITNVVHVDDNAGALTVDGTVTANQGAAGANSWLVDLGVNNDVTVAALPLPAGAATSAAQLPDGHNVTVDNAGSVSAVNIQDGGNNISIDDGGNTITVDGTVAVTNADITSCKTALELLDNSVDGNYLNVNMNIAGADVSATVPMPVRPNEFELAGVTTHVKKYYTSAGAATDGIIWSPAAGKRWYVTDIYIQVSAAATVTLEDDLAAGDSAIWKAELAANGGWSHSFQTPWFSGEDAADLLITTSAGNVYVMCTGYEI